MNNLGLKGQTRNEERSWIDGCFISKISRSRVLALVSEWIDQGKRNKYITAINVSKLAMMQKDKKLSDFVLNSSITIADGFPIYLATRLTGNPVPERITGVDLMEHLLKLANDKQYTVYLLGSKPRVLNEVTNKLQYLYPDIAIAGSRDGYFRKEEELLVVQEISAARPDILLVALGLPQKEYFIDNHRDQLNAAVILPVGGAFDVLAGFKKRAPQWVQNAGIEWLWRSVYDRSRAALILSNVFSFTRIVITEIIRQRLLGKRRN
ncbi:MAG: WecB/TagA/CpsF family glycosyltransferase [Deltaproteobacteria bacterium]|nr:WecB/TagA/CpsF family glycosyltransferase [Deltaproteobacteria bacterium]